MVEVSSTTGPCIFEVFCAVQVWAPLKRRSGSNEFPPGCGDLQHVHTHTHTHVPVAAARQQTAWTSFVAPFQSHRGSLWTHRLFTDVHTTDRLFCRVPHRLHHLSRGETTDPHCLSLLLPPCFVPLCFLRLSFLFSPLRCSLTCHCYLGPLPCGSWGSRRRNTGTNRGRESGDEGHRLGFICVTSPPFTRSYNRPSIPSPMWGRVTPPKKLSAHPSPPLPRW